VDHFPWPPFQVIFKECLNPHFQPPGTRKPEQAGLLYDIGHNPFLKAGMAAILLQSFHPLRVFHGSFPFKTRLFHGRISPLKGINLLLECEGFQN
jgi:hypothetical protein